MTDKLTLPARLKKNYVKIFLFVSNKFIYLGLLLTINRF